MPYPGSIIDRAIGVLKLHRDRWIDGVEMAALLGLTRDDRALVCKEMRRAHAEGFLVRRPISSRRFEYQLAPGIDTLVANAARACTAAKREGGRRSGESRRERRAS